jgi:replicative DNA helicase
MMMYREEYYDEFSDKKWVTDILIRKNRNGPTGNIELIFNKNSQKFLSVDKNHSSWIRQENNVNNEDLPI